MPDVPVQVCELKLEMPPFESLAAPRWFALATVIGVPVRLVVVAHGVPLFAFENPATQLPEVMVIGLNVYVVPEDVKDRMLEPPMPVVLQFALVPTAVPEYESPITRVAFVQVLAVSEPFAATWQPMILSGALVALPSEVQFAGSVGSVEPEKANTI